MDPADDVGPYQEFKLFFHSKTSIMKLMSRLQEIQDYYMSQGLSGEALRQALEKDEEFQLVLKEWKEQVRDKFGITKEEETKYYLPKQEDYEILAKVKELQDINLNEHDRELVGVVKAQLLAEWRQPLLEKLNRLLEKYK